MTNRRQFLKAAAAAPLVLPAATLAKTASSVAPSDRVRLAIVGCGLRGRQLAANLPAAAQLIAVADANLPRAEALADKHGPGIEAVADYRRLMGRADLDGVIVCSVDHHHAHAGILACVAGHDAYVEKPLTTYFAEGRALVDAARRHGRVVQVGTQQRTMERDVYACELIRDGGLGKVRVVEAVNYGSSHPCPPLDGEPIPEGLDWDLWLGPAPVRPYHRRLAAHWGDGVRGHWGVWRDYSVGGIGGMGAHSLDMVQYALGTDDTGPVEFTPVGPDEAGTERVDFRYASGVEVRMRFLDRRPFFGPRLGAVFVGERGKIEVNRNRVKSNPPELTADAPGDDVAAKWEGDGWIARPHVADWLDAMATRRRPNADVEVGHRTATICHLIAITRQLDRPLRWDPAAERVVDDEEANALLDRPRRAGWELPS